MSGPVDLGLRGAVKRLREGTWHATAAQVERAADEIDRLTVQRDDLLAACEAALHDLREYMPNVSGEAITACEAALRGRTT